MLFTFRGRNYEYLDHPYNTTRVNERAVEIPIFLDFLNRIPLSKRVLEVGCTLRHYHTIMHTQYTTLDKYEQCAGVINQDIEEFKDEELFDYILSVSTFEHPGNDWNEEK